ncbi:MAG: ATP-grasp domain-containing protein [Methylococcaceae bacterium]
MKILLFEYITGGGFNKHELPASLADEGLLMLQALLDNFSTINSNEIIVMLDWRVIDLVDTRNMNIFIIKPEHQTNDEFVKLARQCDAVWPIAPEFDGILQTLCQAVELLDKQLLTSPATAVAMTANKLNTYQRLMLHNIATITTQRLVESENWLGQTGQEWIIKPIDGVGCADSYLITSPQDSALIGIQQDQYIIQPHIQGIKTSLSCLFKQGKGWLLSANLQQFRIINKQYQLSHIIVNHDPDLSKYQDLVDKIALAFPELWGYAGIDLIETPEQILVLEINPRLTTSFSGIYAALGINVAENVLQLLEGHPTFTRVANKPIIINLRHNETNV